MTRPRISCMLVVIFLAGAACGGTTDGAAPTTPAPAVEVAITTPAEALPETSTTTAPTTSPNEVVEGPTWPAQIGPPLLNGNRPSRYDRLPADYRHPDAEAEAVSTYLEWQQMRVATANPPAPDSPEISKLSTNVVLTWLVDQRQRYLDEALTFEGTYTTNPRFEEWINPSGLLIIDCFSEDWTITSADGSIESQDENLGPQRREVVMDFEGDDRWRVFQYVVRDQPC